jgi:hypothetical protein
MDQEKTGVYTFENRMKGELITSASFFDYATEIRQKLALGADKFYRRLMYIDCCHFCDLYYLKVKLHRSFYSIRVGYIAK